MSESVRRDEPSAAELQEIPEVDFSRAIRPNRYANLRGAFQHAVYLDRDLWEHFGSSEKVLDALRMLVEIAEREVGRREAPPREPAPPHAT